MGKKRQLIRVAISVSGTDPDIKIKFRGSLSDPPSADPNRLVLSGGTIDLRELPYDSDYELHTTIVLRLSGKITIGDEKYPVSFAAKNGAFIKPNKSYGRIRLVQKFRGRPGTELELDYPFNGDGRIYEYGLNLFAPGTDWTHQVDPAIINRDHGGP